MVKKDDSPLPSKVNFETIPNDVFQEEGYAIATDLSGNCFKTKGLQGPKGEKGDPGETGAEGPRGPPGTPLFASYSFTATTAITTITESQEMIPYDGGGWSEATTTASIDRELVQKVSGGFDLYPGYIYEAVLSIKASPQTYNSLDQSLLFAVADATTREFSPDFKPQVSIRTVDDPSGQPAKLFTGSLYGSWLFKVENEVQRVRVFYNTYPPDAASIIHWTIWECLIDFRVVGEIEESWEDAEKPLSEILGEKNLEVYKKKKGENLHENRLKPGETREC